MRFSWLLGLLAAVLAAGQTTPSAAPPPQKTPAAQTPAPAAKPPARDDDDDDEKPAAAATPQANVPESAPVLTIKGVCNGAKSATATSAGDCKTVITRAEFEKLANALQPNMPPQVKRQLANAYPRLLAMSREAEKRGLDKTPAFAEKMKWAKMQALNQDLNRDLQAQADKVSDQDIEDYYKKNQSAFEQATLERIFVPKAKQAESKEGESPDEAKAKQQASEEAMTKEAEALRTRAAGGEDFEKLQKEAFDSAELKGNPPSSNMGKVRRNNLPPAHASVFDLKPGEVSQVINDGASGHYIYKLVSKDLQPLDQVKDEIHAQLRNQRMRDSVQAIQNSATPELNEAYFGPAGPNPPMPGGRPPMAPPPNAPKPPAK
jgi:hypothetical protein